MLLRDIRDLFIETDALALASCFIAQRLGETEERPWADYRMGKAITPSEMVKLLKGFDITPRRMRIGKGEPVRGHELNWFADILATYFPAPGQVEQPEQPDGDDPVTPKPLATNITVLEIEEDVDSSEV